jgi:hypothetical protein
MVSTSNAYFRMWSPFLSLLIEMASPWRVQSDFFSWVANFVPVLGLHMCCPGLPFNYLYCNLWVIVCFAFHQHCCPVMLTWDCLIFWHLTCQFHGIYYPWYPLCNIISNLSIYFSDWLNSQSYLLSLYNSYNSLILLQSAYYDLH